MTVRMPGIELEITMIKKIWQAGHLEILDASLHHAVCGVRTWTSDGALLGL